MKESKRKVGFSKEYVQWEQIEGEDMIRLIVTNDIKLDDC
jgi:hypothetical protein